MWINRSVHAGIEAKLIPVSEAIIWLRSLLLLIRKLVHQRYIDRHSSNCSLTKSNKSEIRNIITSRFNAVSDCRYMSDTSYCSIKRALLSGNFTNLFSCLQKYGMSGNNKHKSHSAFHRQTRRADAQGLNCVLNCVFLWCKWVTGRPFSLLGGNTPRRELKIQRAAEYFWRNSRCWESRWNTVSSVWNIFSIETKPKE